MRGRGVWRTGEPIMTVIEERKKGKILRFQSQEMFMVIHLSTELEEYVLEQVQSERTDIMMNIAGVLWFPFPSPPFRGYIHEKRNLF